MEEVEPDATEVLIFLQNRDRTLTVSSNENLLYKLRRKRMHTEMNPHMQNHGEAPTVDAVLLYFPLDIYNNQSVSLRQIIACTILHNSRC